MGRRYFLKAYHNDPSCCGMALKNSTLLVGSVEMVSYLIGLLSSVHAIWKWKVHEVASDSIDSSEKYVAFGRYPDASHSHYSWTTGFVSVTASCVLFIGIVSALLLIVAARIKSQVLCKSWMLVKLVLVTMAFIHLILSHKILAPWGIAADFMDGLLIIFSVPSFVAVYSFVDEMRKKEAEAEMDRKQRNRDVELTVLNRNDQ